MPFISSAKTDLNFEASPLFDGKDWRDRATGQPFFAQITLGITHRNPRVGWEKVRKQSAHPVDPQADDVGVSDLSRPIPSDPSGLGPL